MNFKKIERIASELEKQLGMDEAGNELIDNAEDSISDKIDQTIKNEKKTTHVPESSLEASDDVPDDCCIVNQQEARQVLDDIADIEQKMDEIDDGSDSADKYDVKACIAGMKKLIRIARKVKMSKDMPETRKEEVLGKIQKASEKLRRAAGKSVEDQYDTYTNQSMRKRDNTVNYMSLKRGITPKSIGKLMRSPSATMSRIFSKVGDKMDVNVPVNRMTASMFINLLAALEETLSEMN